MLAVVWGVVAAQATLIPSQTPLILPGAGTFQGAVNDGVAILSSGDQLSTKLYYTVSKCCDCVDFQVPNPKVVGIDKPTRELKPNARIPITRPGKNCVAAVALTTGQDVSDVAKVSYVVSAPPILPPVVGPQRGKYNGFVVVNITNPNPSKSVVFYTLDSDPPTLTKPGTQYTGPFFINTQGLHYVRAFSISLEDKTVTSPVVDRALEVVLPVAYKVLPSICAGCKGPTVGFPFSIMFQGFKPTIMNRVFLTTSKCPSTGLKLLHELEGCNCPQGLVPEKLQLQILSRDVPTEVRVCYTSNGGQKWREIPQADPRLRSGSKPNITFSLLPPPGTAEQTVAADHDGDGKLLIENAPFDYAEFANQQQRAITVSRQSTFDNLTPAAAIISIVATGVYIVFRRGRT